ncbi:hypothetical protein EV363DRAFT_1392186 [Boletus edulis]|nr:hypothetical protein EV363DRAFT_1392186 [Boletus edulis]
MFYETRQRARFRSSTLGVYDAQRGALPHPHSVQRADTEELATRNNAALTLISLASLLRMTLLLLNPSHCSCVPSFRHSRTRCDPSSFVPGIIAHAILKCERIAFQEMLPLLADTAGRESFESSANNAQLELFLLHVPVPVYHITEEGTIRDAGMEELKTTAIELQDLDQAKVGTTAFAHVYHRIRQGVVSVQQVRRVVRVTKVFVPLAGPLRATIDPEAAAKHKLARTR